MSFRFLMALGCCFIYSTTASASVTFIAGDGDQSFSSKNFTTQSISCPEGTVLYNGKCEETCEDYPLTQIDPKKGEYIERTCRGVKYYRYTSCHNGWEAVKTNSPNIEAANARVEIGEIHDGSILSPSAPRRDDVFNPARDGGSRLRAMSAVSAGNSKINQGNNKSKQNIIKDCVIPADCANYYSGSFSSTAGVVIEKKCGEETKYRYSKCHVGWSPRIPTDGKSCNRTTCSLSAYPYEGGDYGHIRTTLENCPTGQTCNDTTEDSKGEIRVCFSGNDTHWGYTKCNEGWLGDNDSTTPVNGDCTESACNGYIYSEQPEHCEEYEPCAKGNGVVYRCTRASNGYTIADDGTIVPNDCSATKYQCSDSTCTIENGEIKAIQGCKKWNSCLKGDKYFYTCIKVADGYYLDDGLPVINSCEGFSSTNSEIENCAEVIPCHKGSQTLYRCESCNRCYKVADNGTCALKDALVEPEIGCTVKYNGTPIGIVVLFNEESIRIAGLKLIDANSQEYEFSTSMQGNHTMLWCHNSKYQNVDMIGYKTTYEQANADMNGMVNTFEMRATGGEAMKPAVAAYNYAPAACPAGSWCGKEKWYLPAYGETKGMRSALPANYCENFDNTNPEIQHPDLVAAFGRDVINLSEIWTSTQSSQGYAWVARAPSSTNPNQPGCNMKGDASKTQKWTLVRPFMRYCRKSNRCD